MPKQKLDKLGRRIPQFDRSKAMKKGALTTKEKHGSDFHKRTGIDGGRARSRGYFGTLKDQGKLDELKAISIEAAKKSAARTPEERKNSVIKGWQTKHKAQKRGPGIPRARKGPA